MATAEPKPRVSRSWSRHQSFPLESGNAPTIDTPISVSQAGVMKRVLYFTGYSEPESIPDVIVREGLRNIEDSIPYGVSATIQEELWRAEVSRLADVVEKPEEPICFRGSDALAYDTKPAYDMLASLANSALVATYLIVQDAQGIIANRHPNLMSQHLYNESRQALERFVRTREDDQEEEDEHHEDNEGQQNSGEDVIPEPVREPECRPEDYVEFVNCITAVLARSLCRAASGVDWHEGVLACIAKISTKLKIVSHSLKDAVHQCLENNPSSIDRSQVTAAMVGGHDRGQHGGKGAPDPLRDMMMAVESLSSGNATNSDQTTQSTANHLRARYWLDASMQLFFVTQILEYILVSLRGTNRLAVKSTTSYELCSVLYRSTFDNFTTLLYQDVDGEYVGTSKMEQIKVAHAAYSTLKANIEAIEKHRKTARQGSLSTDQQPESSGASQTATLEGLPAEEDSSVTNTDNNDDAKDGTTKARPIPPADMPQLVGTTLSWNHAPASTSTDSQKQSEAFPHDASAKPGQFATKELKLKSMEDVITALVSIISTSPKIILIITEWIGAEALRGPRKVRLTESPTCQAFYSLSTTKYREVWSHPSELPLSPLSETFMVRNISQSKPGGAFSTGGSGRDNDAKYKDSSKHNRPSLLSGEKEQAMKIRAKISEADARMNKWIIEENGVRVYCVPYVSFILGLAAVFSGGGIIAAFTIGNRLDPIDPMNIPMFCWVLAGFFILVSKSIRVAEWPWRDFLRGQVLCRSVSELHSVSGIDEQLILAKLLQEETSNRLITRGPFNSIFSRRSENGFSIDAPVNMKTMAASGLIMVVVQSQYYGKFLVCLDVRKGTRYQAIFRTSIPMGDRELIFSDPLNLKNGRAEDDVKIPLQIGEDSQWSRIVGLYANENCSFA